MHAAYVRALAVRWIFSCSLQRHKRVMVGSIFISLVVYLGGLVVKRSSGFEQIALYCFHVSCPAWSKAVYQHASYVCVLFLSCHTKFSAYS